MTESFKEKYNYHLATPVMQQYLDVKEAHIDCLVLFRMGDFYELFYDDAVKASATLGIALTKRGKNGDEDIPMCGVPHHSIESHLVKLMEDEFKVAICDQLESPEEAKKRGGYKAVVKRDIVRIITPGTIIEESLLESSEPNYLSAIAIHSNAASICSLDLSTSEILVTNLPVAEVNNELARLKPNEILLSEKYRLSEISTFISTVLDKMITFQVDSFFAPAKCENIIKKFYNIISTDALGKLEPVSISAIGAILEYISITQKQNLPQLPFPCLVDYNNFLQIDSSTRRNLELTYAASGARNTLYANIDKTQTKAGSRLLYKYLLSPLTNLEQINLRLSITEFFKNNLELINKIRNLLQKTSDLERCVTRLAMNRSTPRDLLSIKYTIEVGELIYGEFIKYIGINLPGVIGELIAPLLGNNDIFVLINDGIREDALNNLAEGNYIRHEFHPKVKELHNLIENTSHYIDQLRDKYRKMTGIDNLKITHNNLLGLFIEVTSRNSEKMQDSLFIHRQSTVNAARYTTVDLQELESKIVNAKQLVVSLEKELFDEITKNVMDKRALLFALAESLAQIDLFVGFAYQADLMSYTKPEITDDHSLEIQGGRHPVIENSLRKQGKDFIPNNCNLNFEKRIWLITGPNMSGKSTFLRQNALIVIMAQIGSFVPAEYAKIGVTDKIFSRIGAGDDLSRGQSTFMVEMLETAAILSQSTQKSLIILDEVGRGTSTYDGMAIAWSVLEYVHDKLKARCLFATHYHELVQMEAILPAIANYTIAIDESNGQVTFLHKIIKGAADKSYGVHVAKLAGLPKQVLNRAEELLKKFEKDANKQNKEVLKGESINMNLFDLQLKVDDKSQELIDKLNEINPDVLSPKEALEVVYQLKSIIDT